MWETDDFLLRVSGLCKSYGDFALQDVSFEVPEGCVVGLVGANGAGKSTIIKCILGLTSADSGSVSLLGKDATGLSEQESMQLRSKVGIVFDSCAYPDVLSVKEIARIARSAYPDFDQEFFWALIGKMGVPKEKRVKELSRGTGMKLSLALAIAARPELLILDEATAGLDPLARGEALSLIRSCMLQAEEEGRGLRGVLMCSHISDDLEKLADYVVCIDEGRIVFSVEACKITDLAGVAHCTRSDFERLATFGDNTLGGMRVIQRAYCTDVLVSDRRLFAESFPGIPVERVGLDDYLAFFLKGDTL